MKIVRISSSWCSSCIITYKNYKKLQEKYPEFEYEEFDFDEDEEVVNNLDIGNILPVIIVYKDNKEIKRIVGEKNEKELIKEIEELV